MQEGLGLHLVLLQKELKILKNYGISTVSVPTVEMACGVRKEGQSAHRLAFSDEQEVVLEGDTALGPFWSEDLSQYIWISETRDDYLCFSLPKRTSFGKEKHK